MNISGKVSALLLILIFSFIFGQEAKEIKWGKIKGTILDENRNPIFGAEVTIVGTTWVAESDEDGYYYIIGIRPGSYNLKAQYINYDPQTFENLRVSIGLTTTQNFQLSKSDLKDSCKVEVVPEQKVEMDIDGGPPRSLKYKHKGSEDNKADTQHPRTVDMEEIETLPVTPVEKPIIYLYPEKETEIKVKLDYKGTFTVTYPKYSENGWAVTAKPDGTLADKKGKKYYSLFWEGVTDKTFTVNEGFVIKKEDTADFFEKSLITLGLNFKEANEFIIYWLPELEKHPYNLIHFSTKEYEDLAELTVDPRPDTIIRVFMVFKGLDKPVEILEQKFVSKSRKGFTVVEWGGTEIKDGTASRIK